MENRELAVNQILGYQKNLTKTGWCEYAERYLLLGLELSKSINDPAHEKRASLTMSLSEIYEENGHYGIAKDLLIQLMAEIEKDDTNNSVIPLKISTLATDLSLRNGDAATALKYARESYRYERAMNKKEVVSNVNLAARLASAYYLNKNYFQGDWEFENINPSNKADFSQLFKGNGASNYDQELVERYSTSPELALNLGESKIQSYKNELSSAIEPRSRNRLEYQLARTLLTLGEFWQATHQIEKAKAAYNNLITNDISTFQYTIRRNLAYQLLEEKNATDVQEHVIWIRKNFNTLFGSPSHVQPESIDFFLIQAVTMQLEHNAAEAEKFFSQCLPIAKFFSSSNSPRLVNIISELGQVQYEQGKFDDARINLEQALEQQIALASNLKNEKKIAERLLTAYTSLKLTTLAKNLGERYGIEIERTLPQQKGKPSRNRESN